MQIVRSVRMEEIDPAFLETSYYVYPGNGAEHSYALFYRALHTQRTEGARRAHHVLHPGRRGARAGDGCSGKGTRSGEEFVEAIAAPFSPE